MKLVVFLFQIVNFQFQQGDLLFQDCDCGPICEAIEDVTELNDKRRFSHMAIVVADSNELKVVEANVDGVRMVALDSFIDRYRDKNGNPKIAVGRLIEDCLYYIPRAVEFVKEKIGMKYDYAFVPNNNKYYCSELIYEAFRYANMDEPLFREQPMTFKKYKSSRFHPEFLKYYIRQKKRIPEGKKGTNPAGISREKYLSIQYLY